MIFGHGGWSAQGCGWTLANDGTVRAYWNIDTAGLWLDYSSKIFDNPNNIQLYAKLTNITSSAWCTFLNKKIPLNNKLITVAPYFLGTDARLHMVGDTTFNSKLEIFDSLDSDAVPIMTLNVYNRYVQAWT